MGKGWKFNRTTPHVSSIVVLSRTQTYKKSRDREVWRVVLPDRPFLRHRKSVPGTRIAYPWLECSELDVCECSFQTVGAPGSLLSWSLECPQIPRVRIAVLLLKYLLQIHENIDKFRFGLGILVERILEDNNFPNLAFLGMTKEFGKLNCYQVIMFRIRALFDVVLQSSRSLFVTKFCSNKSVRARRLELGSDCCKCSSSVCGVNSLMDCCCSSLCGCLTSLHQPTFRFSISLLAKAKMFTMFWVSSVSIGSISGDFGRMHKTNEVTSDWKRSSG